MNEVYKCPECGAYWHNGKEAHGIVTGGKVCPKQSIEYLWRTAQAYYDAWLDERRQHIFTRKRLTDYATTIQGKHAILRHENNKLRRKLIPPTPSPNASKPADGKTDSGTRQTTP